MPVNITEETSAKSSPRPTWGYFVAFGILFAFLVLLGYGLWKSQQGSIRAGENSPDFSLTTFDGQQIDLNSLTGNVVVLNFWASWCTTCEEEATDLQAAWNYYQSQDNVIFIGVDYMDSEQKAIAYIEKYNITYPNAPDTGGWVSSSFRVRGVPETFVIDPSGKIASIKIGPYSSLAEIQAAIDPLLTQQ